MPMYKIIYADGNSIIEEAENEAEAYIKHRFDVCSVVSVEECCTENK